MKNLIASCLILGASLLPRLSPAQSLHEFEQHLKSLFTLQKEQIQAGNQAMDSLEKINGEIHESLMKTLLKMPQTLSTNLHLPEGLSVTTSADKMVRAWSWDTWTGGTIPDLELLVQYQSPNGVRVEDLLDTVDEGGGNNYWFDTIYIVRTTSEKTVYLPLVGSKASTSLVGQDIEAFTITDTGLNWNITLFQTPKKLLKSIGFSYNYFTNYDTKSGKERHRIHLEDDNRVLIIPITRPSDNDITGDRMTSKSLRYEFDGEHFVYKGIAK